MSELILALCAALAGGGGAVLRHVVDLAATKWWLRRGGTGSLPVGQLIVNVSGSLLIGLLAGVVAAEHAAHVIVGAGLLGGYTTFSAASYRTVQLLRRRHVGWAALVGFGQLIVAVAAAGCGLWLGVLISG